MQVINAVRKIAQSISLAMVVTWLGAIIFFYGVGPYFMAGMLLWLIILSISLMAWKTDVFGGSLFILSGVILTLIILFNELPLLYYWLVLPLLSAGTLYVTHYYLVEKKNKEEVDDF